jgi:glycolate oxidase FAD binding subunit
MKVKQKELARLIEPIVGADNLAEISLPLADGVKPALAAHPASRDEVAGCLRACSDASFAVVPSGFGSWLDCGNLLKSADLVLSLDRMNRIIDYSPPDLTATVEAGMALSEFNAAAAVERQWLPLDPTGMRLATIGAIAACNSSGPLRLAYGTPRDYVIGLRVAHIDGTESKAGGRVVKNVAGYDMNKLYIGSFGTLAVITEVTLKLRPLPESIVTVAVTPRGRAILADLAKRIRASDLQPVSLFIIRDLSEERASGYEESLLVRFAESRQAVNHQVETVEKLAGEEYRVAILSAEQDSVTWQRVAETGNQVARTIIKISVPVSKALGFYEHADLDDGSVAAVDAGTGIIRIMFKKEEASARERITILRSRACEMGGSLFIERAAEGVKGEVDAWGDVGATEHLMRALKAKFDPQSLLNPGRFVAGI